MSENMFYDVFPGPRSTGIYGTQIQELEVTCGRCHTRVYPRQTAYRCIQCPNFDLCLDCAAKGIYCQDDTHEWRQVSIGEYKQTPMGIVLETSGGRIQLPQPRLYPYVFRPTSNEDTPESLFDNEHRFISKRNPREILIHTDGACSNNGRVRTMGETILKQAAHLFTAHQPTP